MKRSPRSEVFFFTLPVLDGQLAPRFRHGGEEITLVLEGRMLFRIRRPGIRDGALRRNPVRLGHWTARVALGDRPAKVFVVTIPDRNEPGTRMT